MSDEKSPVRVDVSAGVNLKAEVTTEIPSESSGRLLDALTDIMRPFSEKRGLRADLIRLQRESVLIEIAQLARQRAQIEGAVIAPVSNRVLVPFLEKASLVGEDDDLLKRRWADLLYSASQNISPNFPLFIDALGKLDPAHIEMLDLIWDSDNPALFAEAPSIARRGEFDHYLTQSIKAIRDSEHKGEDEEQLLEDIFDIFENRYDGCGVKIDFLIAGDGYESVSQISKGRNSDVIIQALVSLGLLQTLEVWSDHLHYYDLKLDFLLKIVAFTEFGVEFFESCNNLDKKTGQKL